MARGQGQGPGATTSRRSGERTRRSRSSPDGPTGFVGRRTSIGRTRRGPPVADPSMTSGEAPVAAPSLTSGEGLAGLPRPHPRPRLARERAALWCLSPRETAHAQGFQWVVRVLGKRAVGLPVIGDGGSTGRCTAGPSSRSSARQDAGETFHVQQRGGSRQACFLRPADVWRATGLASWCRACRSANPAGLAASVAPPWIRASKAVMSASRASRRTLIEPAVRVEGGRRC